MLEHQGQYLTYLCEVIYSDYSVLAPMLGLEEDELFRYAHSEHAPSHLPFDAMIRLELLGWNTNYYLYKIGSPFNDTVMGKILSDKYKEAFEVDLKGNKL